MFEFAIVAVAYNRERSLARLLSSLNQLIVPLNHSIPLIISIDGGGNPQTEQVAADFNWRHGEKRLILHEQNLGLERHIHTCMELSNDYSNVVILEDDCYLSPFAYDFIEASIRTFSDDENICGISLYSFDINEFARLPFLPVEDGFDNYFMKVPSSYGQIISKKMWNDFKKSSEQELKVLESDPLPDEVLSWSNSWKKQFFKYMLNTGRYFLFPRISLTTNFCDAGIHFPSPDKRYQVSLLNGKKEYRLSTLSQSGSTYDSFFEFEKRNIKNFTGYGEIEFDLYGLKTPAKYKDSHFITAKTVTGMPEKSYGFEMLPHDLNVIHNIPGNDFHLVKTDQITSDNIAAKSITHPIIAKIRDSSAFSQLRNEIEGSVKQSLTYRTGRLITTVPRYLKQKLFKSN